MCLFKKKTNDYPVQSPLIVSRTDYLAVMQRAGINSMACFDSALSVATRTELDRIAPYLVLPADYYIAEIFDCEDYGIMTQGIACQKFHVSGIRLGLGFMPSGYHGFVITLDTEFHIWLLEPNAGFDYAGRWFRIGENGYQPDKILA